MKLSLTRPKPASRRRQARDLHQAHLAQQLTASMSPYLTDGQELYRFLGAIADDARMFLGIENCRSLEILLVPAAELTHRLREVAADRIHLGGVDRLTAVPAFA